MSLLDDSDKWSVFHSFPLVLLFFKKASDYMKGGVHKLPQGRGENRWTSYPNKALGSTLPLLNAPLLATPRLVTSRVQLVVCGDVLSSGGGGSVEWEIVVGMCQFLSLYSGPDHLSHLKIPAHVDSVLTSDLYQSLSLGNTSTTRSLHTERRPWGTKSTASDPTCFLQLPPHHHSSTC